MKKTKSNGDRNHNSYLYVFLFKNEKNLNGKI